MELKIIGSNSSGNGYILETKYEALVIEAGCSLLALKKAIDFNISKIVGVLQSHGHQDHSKYAVSYMQSGLKVFADIPEGRGSKHHNLNPIIGQFQVGGFKIKPFDLFHDVPIHGFLIWHHECGNVLFATDTSHIPYNFEDLNQIIIEANYDEDILDDNVINGKVPLYLRNRVKETHLSLASCRKFLEETNLGKVINIVLIHLSSDNSHAVNFAKEIKSMTATRVWIADKGMIIPFDKNPF